MNTAWLKNASNQIASMSGIIFEVREADEGGFWACALGHSIFTQGEDGDDLRTMVKDAVACHFVDGPRFPKVFRLQFRA